MNITAAAIPIPAFAPTLSPWFVDEAFDKDVGSAAGEVALLLDVVSRSRVNVLELGANEFIADDIDVAALWPTVAASANKLDSSPQQLDSPQHQRFFPHFRTGALSLRHCMVSALIFPPGLGSS